MWLNQLKIAVIEKDASKLEKLLDDIPELKNPKDAENAVYLLKEARKFIEHLRDETSNSMRQIQKNIEFLKSNEWIANNRFDKTF